MVRPVAKAFMIVLLALIAIRVAAELAAVSIGPIAALLVLVLLVIWFADRNGFHL